MKINYYLIDPTRNMTILVETPVPIELQPEVGRKLMELEPIAEQVGFVSGDRNVGGADICMRMAGGEFCGNATMSAAALFCEKARLPRGVECEVRVNVWGVDKPVEVGVEITESGKYHGTVTMPAPKSMKTCELEFKGTKYNLTVVEFTGISHIIAENLSDRSMAEEAVKQWCRDLGCDALGLMLYDTEQGRIDPLVYVSSADTMFWESSCASGTTAVGAYLLQRSPDTAFVKFREPGGELSIEARPDGTILLSGHVRVVRKSEGVEV